MGLDSKVLRMHGHGAVTGPFDSSIRLINVATTDTHAPKRTPCNVKCIGLADTADK